ncbi:MAG: hypothetical protein AAB922_05870, partial [Patescibacteria group bacterium]
MAKATFQNMTVDIPDYGWFKVKNNEDRIFKATPQGVEQYNLRYQPDLYKQAQYPIETSDLSIPEYNPEVLAWDIPRLRTIKRTAVTPQNVAGIQSMISGASQTAPSYNAMEEVLKLQGLPAGSAIPGATVGANIVAQPGIAPTSTLSYVAQSIGDIQRRIDEIKGKPISTTSITGAPSVPYTSPATTTAPSVSGIVAGALGGTSGTSGIQMTPEQQDAQNMSDRLQKLNLELAGKATDILTERKTQGVSDTQTTIDDLTSQLLALDAQAKAIPEQMQKVTEGRGITVAGLAPMETAALRNNAIQALGLSEQDAPRLLFDL